MVDALSRDCGLSPTIEAAFRSVDRGAFFPAACEVASAQTVRAVKYDGVGDLPSQGADVQARRADDEMMSC